MKIYNLFDNEELEALTQNDYVIGKREYTYSEIDNILRNIEMECFFEKYRKTDLVKTYKNIILKLKKIKSSMPECFNYRKWKSKRITTTQELKTFFNDEKLIGKKIAKISFCGTPSFLTKNNMLTLYNNSEELMKDDEWWLMQKITKEYIPGHIKKNLITSFDCPLVIEFTDGSTIEILQKDYGTYLVSANKIKNTDIYSSEIIGEKFFEQIIGLAIEKIKIDKFKAVDKNYWAFNSIKSKYKTESNPKEIKIFLENGLCLEIINNMVGITDGKQNFLEISIEKYKTCIKHYDWLFSDVAIERGKGNKNVDDISQELSAEDKELIFLLKELEIPKGVIIAILIMTNKTKSSKEMIDWIVERCEKKDLDITTSEILEKAHKLKGEKLRQEI